MKKVLIIEDNPRTLKELIDVFLPDDITESPGWGLTVCTTQEVAESIDPGGFDYILLDHDLPDRGNGGRILNHWASDYDGLENLKENCGTKIIAISCVPINNKRLLDLGADIAIDKMDPLFMERLKGAINGVVQS